MQLLYRVRTSRRTSKMQMLVLTDNLSARKSNSNTVCFQTNYRRLNTLYNNTNWITNVITALKWQIAYQNKKHTFNWLKTSHVTFIIPRYRLGYWYRPVQKACIDWCSRAYARFLDRSVSASVHLYCVCQILVFNAINNLLLILRAISG